MTKTFGIVAAPHYLASAIGAKVLRRGGNAFDAAVAVSLAIGITQPYHSGLGGGCNITYLTATSEAAHINARGPAPQQVTRESFFKDARPNYDLVTAGALAVTVPSLVAGLVKLHQGRGNLAWEDVCSAPLPLAAEGFSADFMLANVYKRSETRDKVARYGRGSVFAQPIQEGQHVVQPLLAQTLARLARNPRDLYEGEVAHNLVATVQRGGGCLSLDDLSRYRPEVTPLHELEYRGWRVLAPGLPTVGSLQTQLALNMLKRFPLADLGHNSAQHQHLLAEVFKATYLERAKVGGNEAAAAMTDDAVAERLAGEFDSTHAQAVNFGVDERGGESCTSHFCVADAEGNVVSQTQTIRSHFGSGLVDLETGIVLNDSIGDFSLQPGEVTTQGIRYQGSYNLLTPGAEPASSQSPIIALHPQSGDLIAVGAAGGPRIVSATVQALSNQIDFGLNAQLAVALPRMHSHGPITNVEPYSTVKDELQNLGHTIEVFTPSGLAQTIRRRDGSWEGGADPRGPGGVGTLVENEQRSVRMYGYTF